jgi:hypothetical protein
MKATLSCQSPHARLPVRHIIVAAFLIVACASLSQAAVTLESKSAISISGSLNGESLEAFRSLLTDDINTVVIASADGEQPVAGEIGRIIRQRNIQLVVRGYCLGPCANYVFLAARHHTIEGFGFVAFAYTGTMAARLLKNLDHKNISKSYGLRSESELQYFNDLGPRAIVLLESNLETGGDCYAPKYAGDTEIVDVGFRKYATRWVPRRQYLKSLGIDVNGYWPEGAAELRKIHAALFSPDSKTTEKAGESDTPMMMENAIGEIARLPDCSGIGMQSHFSQPPKDPATR